MSYTVKGTKIGIRSNKTKKKKKKKKSFQVLVGKNGLPARSYQKDFLVTLAHPKNGRGYGGKNFFHSIMRKNSGSRLEKKQQWGYNACINMVPSWKVTVKAT